MSAPNDERKVEIAALQQVAAMFQTPSQLEKLDVLMKRADRKKVFYKNYFYFYKKFKAAVEAMLRTGVQSQLEGIRGAIAELQSASEDVKQIEIRFYFNIKKLNLKKLACNLFLKNLKLYHKQKLK